jgi:hypothetical protein
LALIIVALGVNVTAHRVKRRVPHGGAGQTLTWLSIAVLAVLNFWQIAGRA